MTLFDTDEGAPLDLGATARVKLVVAYDGGGFHGFAAQPGVTTVGGTLAGALQRVLGHPVALTCAGRTDTRVHAWGQVVTFDAREDGLDLERVQRAVNKLCCPSIVVRSAQRVDPTFDARRSAVARRYRYSVLNAPVPDPFTAHVRWHVPDALDLGSMRLGCDPLIGEHDFSSFCRPPRGVDQYSMVRRVHDARWRELPDGLLRFDIDASSFCQQMVRSIVGLLVDVGRGRRRAGDVAALLRAGDRSLVSVAPPHGLCLWEVVY